MTNWPSNIFKIFHNKTISLESPSVFCLWSKSRSAANKDPLEFEFSLCNLKLSDSRAAGRAMLSNADQLLGKQQGTCNPKSKADSLTEKRHIIDPWKWCISPKILILLFSIPYFFFYQFFITMNCDIEFCQHTALKNTTRVHAKQVVTFGKRTYFFLFLAVQPTAQ